MGHIKNPVKEGTWEQVYGLFWLFGLCTCSFDWEGRPVDGILCHQDRVLVPRPPFSLSNYTTKVGSEICLEMWNETLLDWPSFCVKSLWHNQWTRRCWPSSSWCSSVWIHTGKQEKHINIRGRQIWDSDHSYVANRWRDVIYWKRGGRIMKRKEIHNWVNTELLSESVSGSWELFNFQGKTSQQEADMLGTLSSCSVINTASTTTAGANSQHQTQQSPKQPEMMWDHMSYLRWWICHMRLCEIIKHPSA